MTQYAASFASNSPTHCQIVMSVVAPALLARATSEGESEGNKGEVYTETSTRLLELASADQQAFRAVVANMNEGQRAFMEEVIRAGRQAAAQGTQGGDKSGGEKPTIALKMDFGGQ